MPEFEVFLGEVAITPYETPGGQAFADTVIPYVKDTDTIILANHGTITVGSDLMDAYFKTEIIDAYCRILILAKQIGPVQYYSDAKAAELLKLKPGIGVRDVRLEKGLENCDLCGNSLFREGYTDFKPEPRAFIPPKLQKAAAEVFMPVVEWREGRRRIARPGHHRPGHEGDERQAPEPRTGQTIAIESRPE